MRIPAVLVVSLVAVACAWLYGPAWVVLGALAVSIFAFVAIRNWLRATSPGRGGPGGGHGTGDVPLAALMAGAPGGDGGCAGGNGGCAGGDGGGACS